MVHQLERENVGKVVSEGEVEYSSVEDAKNSTLRTLGQRNHNPLNIRYTATSFWLGQLGENRGFVVFKTMAYGVRAAYKLLKRYIRSGHNTIEKIVSRWAPPTENDTKAYIEYVSKKTGFPSDYVFAETDTNSIIKVLMAMSYFESNYVVTSFDLMLIEQ